VAPVCEHLLAFAGTDALRIAEGTRDNDADATLHQPASARLSAQMPRRLATWLLVACRCDFRVLSSLAVPIPVEQRHSWRIHRAFRLAAPSLPACRRHRQQHSLCQGTFRTLTALMACLPAIRHTSRRLSPTTSALVFHGGRTFLNGTGRDPCRQCYSGDTPAAPRRTDIVYRAVTCLSLHRPFLSPFLLHTVPIAHRHA